MKNNKGLIASLTLLMLLPSGLVGIPLNGEERVPENQAQEEIESQISEVPGEIIEETTETSEVPEESTETSTSEVPEESTETSTSEVPEESTETSTSEVPEESTETSTSEVPEESTETSTSEVPEESTETSTSEVPEESTETSTSEVPEESTETSTSEVPEESTEISTSGVPEEHTKPSTEVKPMNDVTTKPIIQNVTDNLNSPVLPLEETEELSASNLLDFELPLLSSYQDKETAVLLYGALLYLGEAKLSPDDTEEMTSFKELLNFLETEYFDTPFEKMVERITYKEYGSDLEKETLEEITDYNNLEPGDIIVSKETDKETAALYLGNDVVLTLLDSELDKAKTTEEKNTVEVGTEYFVKEDNMQFYRLKHAKLSKEGKKLLQQYPASMEFKPNLLTKKFIEKIAEDARESSLKYDVYASVLIAQALLESGSGTSGLAMAPNYNLFGIKGSYKGSAVSYLTNEDDGTGSLYTIQSNFRKYPNYKASIGDYISLLKNGTAWDEKYYEGTWRSEAKNYLSAAESLVGKYATDTQYAKKVISLISAYHLTQYDQPEISATVNNSTFSILKNKSDIPKEYQKLMKYPQYNGKNYNTSGSYPVGQCTWYAFNRAAQLGGQVDDFMGNGGEWGTKGKQLGYEVTSTPKAGKLVSFRPGVAGSSRVYGHVAFVEAVTKEGILISEGNVVGGTKISYRIIPNSIARSNSVSYVTPK